MSKSKATAFNPTDQDGPQAEARRVEPPQPNRDDNRQENAAKYREKVDELNRSRDIDIERALTLRAH
jgi:hypothetical protein